MIITKKLNIKNSLSKISKPQDNKLINLKEPLINVMTQSRDTIYIDMTMKKKVPIEEFNSNSGDAISCVTFKGNITGIY